MSLNTDYLIPKNDNDVCINEVRSQFAIEASGVGVWDWNLATNKVFYSPESLRILEINEDNLNFVRPEFWDDLVHPDDKEVYFKNIRLHLEGKTDYYETCHRVLCNGFYKWILDRGKVVLWDENGNPLRIVGTHTDITDQKVREENLLQTVSILNNQKNRLLNFAHIVSHNLKSHSGNISSLVGLKESQLINDDEFYEYITTVSKELTTTIDDLVELVNVENNKNIDKEELNLSEYLDKVFNILIDDINKADIKLVNNVSEDYMVLFNKCYLQSVLLNLTTNAIKYSDSTKDSYIEYSVEKVDNYIVLNVKDNGIGIDLEKHKDSIFGLYKTFHSNSNSSGIGLHITKNQIESMGGKIEVESKINEGTTFKVYFS